MHTASAIQRTRIYPYDDGWAENWTEVFSHKLCLIVSVVDYWFDTQFHSRRINTKHVTASLLVMMVAAQPLTVIDQIG